MTTVPLGAWVAAAFPGAPPLRLDGAVEGLPVPAGATPADLPGALGAAYEASLPAEDRRASGTYYTPAVVADGVVALAVPDRRAGARVLDPAVGSGAFLLATARRLAALGVPRRQVVEHHLFGIDRDPAALEVAATALALWAGPDRVGWPDGRAHLRCADTLALLPDDTLAPWGGAPATTVVGNPPFLGQLRTRTARRARGADRAGRTAAGTGAYTDTAALFLLAGLDLVGPGGRVALLQPESVLTARDATVVRRALLAVARLEHLWVAGGAVFEAATRVCAPVLRRPPTSRRGRGARLVARSIGPRFEAQAPAPAPPADGSGWGALLADLRGVPVVTLGPADPDPTPGEPAPGPGGAGPTPGAAGPRPGEAEPRPGETGTLGDRATVVAGFRQQYYGIVPHVAEAADPRAPTGPRLVTCGVLDPLRCRWGTQETRFARSRWQAPVLDLAGLAADRPDLHRWALDRLRPKLVVATQTRVVEAAVDGGGTWYPSTPALSVEPPDPADLWSLAAVLCAPPVSAWLHARLAGSGLAAHHLRVTAAAVRAIPLPASAAWWAEGAALAEATAREVDPHRHRERLVALGEVMTAAYGAPPAVHRWWVDHLPPAARAGEA